MCRFRLSDNYLRFYLKHVKPNHAAIANNRFVNKSLSTLPGFEAMMGLAFENTVLNQRPFVWQQCGLDDADIVQDGPLFQSPTKRRRGCQIDYMIQSRHGPLYLCEIKLKRTPIGTDVIDELKEKTKRLEIPKHASVLPVLVHVNGVSDTVHEQEYFARIVDFSQI